MTGGNDVLPPRQRGRVVAVYFNELRKLQDELASYVKIPKCTCAAASDYAKIVDLIHFDIWGPNRVVSSCHAKYFLTIVDDYSCATWVYLMIRKHEMGNLVCNFYSLIKTQLIKKLKF